MFTKSERYFYDSEAVKEPPDNRKMRNHRSVCNIQIKGFSGVNFATFQTELVRPCILDLTQLGDYVVDPFFVTITVGVVFQEGSRNYLEI